MFNKSTHGSTYYKPKRVEVASLIEAAVDGTSVGRVKNGVTSKTVLRWLCTVSGPFPSVSRSDSVCA